MASFDKHSTCKRCRNTGLGKDPCFKKLPCEYCDLLTPEQVIQLSTPTYKIRKEKQKSKDNLVGDTDNASNHLFEKRVVSILKDGYIPFKLRPPPGKRSLDSQWLCKPHQEPLLEGSFTVTDLQKGSREGKGSNLSSCFQQTILCTKTKSEMASNLGSQCFFSF